MIWRASAPVTCLFALVVAVAPAGQRNGDPDCRLEITDPRAGQGVPGRIAVKGTAAMSRGTYLWVFVRRWDFEPRWWPQGEAIWDEETKEWHGFATLGKRVDIGWEFDVIAAVVAPKEHLELTDYLKQGMETGRFRPDEFPPALCVSTPVRVIKKSK
ncbi:MAG TPA: hypothetical protein VF121_01480 [Thermoanaerobaculia bacterium]|nr:hypothetical protein [Thermoanaerobaculia bacterium]